jgi:hypothetical protein
MKTKYIKITRSDADGSYIEEKKNLRDVLDAEFLDELDNTEPGTSVTFTVVEMEQELFENLAEFQGW